MAGVLVVAALAGAAFFGWRWSISHRSAQDPAGKVALGASQVTDASGTQPPSGCLVSEQEVSKIIGIPFTLAPQEDNPNRLPCSFSGQNLSADSSFPVVVSLEINTGSFDPESQSFTSAKELVGRAIEKVTFASPASGEPVPHLAQGIGDEGAFTADPKALDFRKGNVWVRIVLEPHQPKEDPWEEEAAIGRLIAARLKGDLIPPAKLTGRPPVEACLLPSGEISRIAGIPIIGPISFFSYPRTVVVGQDQQMTIWCRYRQPEDGNTVVTILFDRGSAEAVINARSQGWQASSGIGDEAGFVFDELVFRKGDTVVSISAVDPRDSNSRNNRSLAKAIAKQIAGKMPSAK